MDIEEQVFSLEQLVNRFNIAGQGVIGGFGESALKEHRAYSIEERIDDLETRVEQFRLTGTEDVAVSGTLDDGYHANA